MTSPNARRTPGRRAIGPAGEALAFALATLVIVGIWYGVMLGTGPHEDAASGLVLKAATVAQVVALLLTAFLAGRRRSWPAFAGILGGYLVWLALPSVL
jgi:hypothetical protein